MPTCEAIVASRSGLHARPASLFARAAAECGHAVMLTKVGGGSGDAASILTLMSLGIAQGDRVLLESSDAAAGPALDELAAMLERDLDAE